MKSLAFRILASCYFLTFSGVTWNNCSCRFFRYSIVWAFTIRWSWWLSRHTRQFDLPRLFIFHLFICGGGILQNAKRRITLRSSENSEVWWLGLKRGNQVIDQVTWFTQFHFLTLIWITKLQSHSAFCISRSANAERRMTLKLSD